MASTATAAAAAGGSDWSSSAPELAACASLLNDGEQKLASMLLECGQAHLFGGWKAEDADDIHAFFAQVQDCEDNYPGGISVYLEHARQLLKDSAADVNPFEGYTPKVPSGVRMKEDDVALFTEMETIGLDVVKDAAFVLVAGGLGERLGYKGIKVALPTNTATMECYMSMYIRQILALQAMSNAASGASRVVPLAIMTSGDTHDKTVQLLKDNANFGMAADQITLMKQDRAPALTDNNASIARDGTYGIVTKPRGHGDVHSLIQKHGLAKKWADEGRKFVCFFQDTNGSCFFNIAAGLGVAAKHDYNVLSMCIPRKAGEAVGAIAELNKADGSSITVNVEYNQLAPLLKATVNKDGDVNDSTGFSPFPGNVNQLIFSVPLYAEVLAKTGGLVPEFVNPKYTDNTKTAFKKPTRLECMMQDYPKLLDSSARVGFVTFDPISFSPVKNSIEGGMDKQAKGLPPQCAISGEADLYKIVVDRLRGMGCDIAASTAFEALGISVDMPPAVVLDPSMTVTRAALAAAFPSPASVHVSSGSTLVVSGSGVVVKDLTLDGALVVTVDSGASYVVDKENVKNAGWKKVLLSELPGEHPEALAIRGYTTVRVAHREVTVDASGKATAKDVEVAAAGAAAASASGGAGAGAGASS